MFTRFSHRQSDGQADRWGDGCMGKNNMSPDPIKGNIINLRITAKCHLHLQTLTKHLQNFKLIWLKL